MKGDNIGCASVINCAKSLFEGWGLTFFRSSVCTGRTVTVGAVLVAVRILKLVFFTVVLAARATLAQLDDLHMLDGGVVTVLAAKSAAGAAAGLAVSRGRSVLFTLTAGSVTLTSLDSLNVLHLEIVDCARIQDVRNRSGKSPGNSPARYRTDVCACARGYSSLASYGKSARSWRSIYWFLYY